MARERWWHRSAAFQQRVRPGPSLMLDPHGTFYVALPQDLVDAVPNHFAGNSTEVKRVAYIYIALDENRQPFHRIHQKTQEIINTMPGAFLQGKRKNST